jgi:predicted PurR-regulated permease PerM
MSSDGGGDVQAAAAAAEQAKAEAEDATAEARRARDDAQDAEQDAQDAEHGAENAEQGAENAEHGAKVAETAAEQAADAADEAARTATAAALDADELLLDEDAQRVAAQVSEEQPFGVPGRAISRRSQVRTGFAITFGGLIAIALAATVVALERELLILVTAAFIAIGLEPVVGWLEHKGMRRGMAVLVVSLSSVAMVGAFLAAAVPPLVNEVTQLIKQGPHFLQELQDRNTFVGHLNTQFHLQDRLTAAASSKLSADSLGGLLSVGQAIVSFTFEVLIVLVLVLYFLADFTDIKRFFYRLAPLERRPRVALLGDEILNRTGGYILGNLFTSLIAVICQYTILRILGVPYALVLSIFVGLLDLVPLVGSTVAGVVVTAVALASVGLTAAIINVVFTIAYRLAEDYLINPRVLKRTVDVRPVVTVVAVLLGGSLLGIIGALIAVPAAAAIQLILTEVVYPKMDSATSEN